ncbi:LCP family protein [uncultured Eubacterium sp.]|uniref:LCP family protein n=1 Tax=uncultured Eubacterium sp. TaxID=165185 RepID=UPI002592D3A7|nr:LCP family protein [uncultured Eubacterium sp.]
MKKKRKKYIKIAIGVVAFILLMAVLGYGLQYIDNKTEKANVSDESSINDWNVQVPRGKIKLNGKKYEYYHDLENYLLIGTDATGNDKDGEDYQGSMADFLMLVIVDKTDNTYSFLQFNRDTMTEIALIDHNGEGEATANIQLCTAHWYGGNKEQSCENTVKAVKKLLGGMQIDGYYEINMSEISKLNSMVDGVTVTLEDDFSKKYPKMKKGATINLNDEQAYAYVHDRYGVGDEENISRMKRQQQYMTGFFKKLQEKVKANPNYANEAFESLQDVATTDITIGKISNISNIFASGTDRGIFALAGKSKVGQALGDEMDHMEFYVNKEAMVSTMSELFGIVEQKNKE